MRIAIACGGTGGHIYPAIALAQELKKRGYSYIVFIVDDNQRAINIIEDTDFEFTVLKAPKMPYGITLRWFRFFLDIASSRFKAESLLNDINPDVVLCFGAYISGPIVPAAKFIGKKVLLHEQNAVLGRANKLFLSKADKVCLSFEHKLLKYGKKYVLTGNPIRKELMEDYKSLAKDRAIRHLGLYPERKTILALGGSRGSSSVNNLLIKLIASLPEHEKKKTQVVHVTGADDLRAVSESYARMGIAHWTSGYFQRVGLLYKAADLIICRSGAATVSEACFFGLPAIFIPYPGAGKHQRENAMVLAKEGAAVMFEEDDLTPEMLREQIFSILKNEPRMKNMRHAMRSFSRPDAAAKLADEVEELENA